MILLNELRTKILNWYSTESKDVSVYWSGNKSIRLLVRLGSNHSIVGLVHNRLIRTFLSGSLWNYLTVGTQCGTGTARTALFHCGPVRTNKRTHPKCSMPLN
jgi:hypothetical protein